MSNYRILLKGNLLLLLDIFYFLSLLLKLGNMVHEFEGKLIFEFFILFE